MLVRVVLHELRVAQNRMFRIDKAEALLNKSAHCSEENRRLLVGDLAREGLVELARLVQSEEYLWLERFRIYRDEKEGYFLKIGFLDLFKRFEHFIIILQGIRSYLDVI